MDKFQVSHDEAEEILDWAISAAAILHLMITAPRSVDLEERLEANEEGIQNMLEQMPPVMVEPVLEWAQECYDNAVQNEEEVQQFVSLLDDVKPEDFGNPDEE